MQEYPECVGVKVKNFAGSCCTAPHNSKLTCSKEGGTKSKLVLLDEEQDVTPQPYETSVQGALLENPQILKSQIDIGAAERDIDNRVGYKWEGSEDDPTVEHNKRNKGGTFGGNGLSRDS